MHFSICDMIKMDLHSKVTIPTKDVVRTIKVTCGDLILSKARVRILHVAARGGNHGITTHHELPAATRRITPDDEMRNEGK